MVLTGARGRGRFKRFVLVGALNTALAYVVYAALVYLGFHYTAASLGSLFLSVVTGFLMHGRLVFGNSEPGRFLLYICMWALLYLINIALIWFFRSLGAGPYFSGALSMPIVVAASYAIQKNLVFRESHEQSLDRRVAQTEPKRHTEK